jgi:hypothetical protein
MLTTEQLDELAEALEGHVEQLDSDCAERLAGMLVESAPELLSMARQLLRAREAAVPLSVVWSSSRCTDETVTVNCLELGALLDAIDGTEP